MYFEGKGCYFCWPREMRVKEGIVLVKMRNKLGNKC